MRCTEVNIHANMIEVTWSHQGLIRLLKNAMIPLTRTQTLYHKKSHGTVVFGPNLRAGYDGMLKRHAQQGRSLETYFFEPALPLPELGNSTAK